VERGNGFCGTSFWSDEGLEIERKRRVGKLGSKRA